MKLTPYEADAAKIAKQHHAVCEWLKHFGARYRMSADEIMSELKQACEDVALELAVLRIEYGEIHAA